MRIIGGRDYYDSALAYGHDEHVTYVRGREELAVPEAEALGIERAEIAIRLHPAGGTRGDHLYHPEHGVFSEVTVRGVHYQQNATTVIACGTRYQGVRVTRWSADPSRGEVLYFWTRARLEAWLAENRLRLEPRRSSAELDAWFQPGQLPNAVLGAVIDRRWTILVHNSPGSWYDPATALWRVDQPVLNEVQFYRVVPPNEMFQEIEMWIGGRLAAASLRHRLAFRAEYVLASMPDVQHVNAIRRDSKQNAVRTEDAVPEAATCTRAAVVLRKFARAAWILGGKKRIDWHSLRALLCKSRKKSPDKRASANPCHWDTDPHRIPRIMYRRLCTFLWTGAVFAASGTAAAQQPLPISFGQDRAVGRDEALGSTMAAGVGPDGSVYVVDHVNSRVVAFDPDGGRRWSAGRRGRGPGEFQVPYRLDVRADGTLFVFDIGTGEVTSLSSEGRYLGRYRLPFRLTQVDNLVAVDDALLISGTATPPSPAAGRGVHRFQISGSELRHSGSFGALPAVRNREILEMWGAGAMVRGAGGIIWYTRRLPYEVYGFDAAGRQRVVFRPPFRTRGTPDDAIRVTRSGRRTTFSETGTQVEVPGPAWELPGGLLLVSRIRPGERFWDIFSTSGRFLGSYKRPDRWEGIAGYDSRRGVLWVTGTHADEPVLYRVPVVLSTPSTPTRRP